MDAQSTVGDVGALVALLQSLARLELDGHASPTVRASEVLAENRFLAARDGMDAPPDRSTARSLVPVREMLDALLGACRPHAVRPWMRRGAGPRVVDADISGADRQPTTAGRDGLEQLVAGLEGRFLASDSIPAMAGPSR